MITVPPRGDQIEQYLDGWVLDERTALRDFSLSPEKVSGTVQINQLTTESSTKDGSFCLAPTIHGKSGRKVEEWSRINISQ
jgi:hypothetical protein